MKGVVAVKGEVEVKRELGDSQASTVPAPWTPAGFGLIASTASSTQPGTLDATVSCHMRHVVCRGMLFVAGASHVESIFKKS